MKINNAIRIGLMSLAPVGLALIVYSVTSPTLPTAPVLTYTGFAFILVGFLGSLIVYEGNNSWRTWWQWHPDATKDWMPDVIYRARGWATGLAISGLLAYVGQTGLVLPGLPQAIAVWNALALFGFIVTIFVLYARWADYYNR